MCIALLLTISNLVVFLVTLDSIDDTAIPTMTALHLKSRGFLDTLD